MKLGIVGTGMIAKDLLSAKISVIDPVAILSTKRSQAIATELANEYGIKQTYVDYDEFLQDPNIDVVYLGIPNNLHYEYAKKALEAKKHVICEKPFVDTVDELIELKTLADKNDVYLLEAITNIHLEGYNLIKKHLPSLGRIHLVNMNYLHYSSRYDAFKAGDTPTAFDPAKNGGCLNDLGIYPIHLLAALFGMPEKIKYQANMERGIDLSGLLTLTYSDLLVNVAISKASRSKNHSVISGENGYIDISGTLNELDEIKIVLPDQIINWQANCHRMVAEFNDFDAILNEQNKKAVDELYQESLTALKILTTAKASR
ncbi:MAG: Gfo/Idh/MocA family oxidoreductase [Lactobacillus sp.]|nr:Gfo/Idh/MocA family oxidoreductase [Lactobacillus sp.]